MFFYASFMLGKPNLVEQRVYLSGMGIAGVGMGVVIAMGLTMLLGFYYTPLHGVMVYLCLGTPWNPLTGHWSDHSKERSAPLQNSGLFWMEI